jgi:nitroreductase
VARKQARSTPLNSTLDLIRARRTVKKFDPARSPSKEQVEAIIHAATWAPNHHSTEPWRFVVVAGDARRRLGETLAQALSESVKGVVAQRVEAERAKPLSAPVIVVLIAAPAEGQNIVPQEELVACGAALQNMLLAAESMGLGSSIRTGQHSYLGEVRRFFWMKEKESLIGMVYLGYAAGPLPPGTRKNFQEKVTWMES